MKEWNEIQKFLKSGKKNNQNKRNKRIIKKKMKEDGEKRMKKMSLWIKMHWRGKSTKKGDTLMKVLVQLIVEYLK